MSVNKIVLNRHLPAISSFDYFELQAILNSRTGSQDVDFLDLKWVFAHKGKLLTLDFKPIYFLLSSSELLSQSKDEILCALKYYWLEQTKPTNPVYVYKSCYFSCCLLITFLCSNQISQLSSANLASFIEYYLCHTWDANGPLKRLNFKSYANFRSGMDLTKLVHSKLSRSPYSLVSTDVRVKSIDDAIASTLDKLTAGELCYKDWRNGKSFNFLTLDHGKYYIEHCANFFETHMPTALALFETLQDAEELVSQAGWPVNGDTKSYLSYCLLNQTPEEISKKRNINLPKVKHLKTMAIKRFQDYYLANQAKFILQSPKAKSVFFSNLAINNLTQSQIERLEYLLEYKAWAVEQYKVEHWLLQMDNPDLTYDKFYNAFISTLTEIDTDTDKIKFELNLESKLPSVEFYESIGLTEPRASGDGYIIQFYRKVLAAGLTDIAASLGWREGELGFPFGAIKIEDNLDYLDQEILPQRFSVHWVVPKTNGKTKIEREITYSTFKKISKIKHFVRSDSASPCLYIRDIFSKNVFDSSPSVQRGIPVMWGHFVRHYPPFIALKNISTLNELNRRLSNSEILSREDYEQLITLDKAYKNENWERFEQDFFLRKTYERVVKELPIVEFFLEGNDIKRKKNWLTRYKNRSLDQDLLDLLDANLSEETRDFIQELEDAPSAVTTRQVSAELVQGCIYPTPHALRHMWAEAVYRRFDGDVGWMIRSQFKHISPSMWLAYVSEKSNASIHDHVQLTVINSIVSSFITKGGVGYSGKLASYLRRVLRMTKIVRSSDGPELLTELITNEFVSIKSNPWGYCILKRRSQRNAKCAENGRPVRDKASPKLCLGCMNNLTEETNLDFIYMLIMNDIEILKSSDIPRAYKKESFLNVKNAIGQIKKLNPNHHILSTLTELVSKGEQLYV